jgi:hypothetical protein
MERRAHISVQNGRHFSLGVAQVLPGKATRVTRQKEALRATIAPRQQDLALEGKENK